MSNNKDIHKLYDEACKHFLCEKSILAWILKYSTEEFANFPIEDIANTYIEGEPVIGNDDTSTSTNTPPKYNLLTVVMICTAEDTSQIENPLLKLLSLIFNQGHDVKELENKLSTDYGINITPDLKERMKDMCNLSYGVDQRGYNRGFNDGGTQRGEQCANDMFTDNKTI